MKLTAAALNFKNCILTFWNDPISSTENRLDGAVTPSEHSGAGTDYQWKIMMNRILPTDGRKMLNSLYRHSSTLVTANLDLSHPRVSFRALEPRSAGRVATVSVHLCQLLVWGWQLRLLCIHFARTKGTKSATMETLVVLQTLFFNNSNLVSIRLLTKKSRPKLSHTTIASALLFSRQLREQWQLPINSKITVQRTKSHVHHTLIFPLFHISTVYLRAYTYQATVSLLFVIIRKEDRLDIESRVHRSEKWDHRPRVLFEVDYCNGIIYAWIP